MASPADLATGRWIRVVIDNDASDDATVIWVARGVNSDHGLSIVHFTTVILELNLVIGKSYLDDGNKSLDVYDVTDQWGNKVLDEPTISCIRERLEYGSVHTTELMKGIMADEMTIKRVAAIHATDKFVSEDVMLLVSSSPKGGIDIKVGYSTVHMPQQSSIRHPVLKMLLFASKIQVASGSLCFRHQDTIPCARSGVAKSILDMPLQKTKSILDTNEILSSGPPGTVVLRTVLEPGWVAARKRPAKSCNGGAVCDRPGKKQADDRRTAGRSTANAGMLPAGLMQLHRQPHGSVHSDSSVREQEELNEQHCRLKNQDAYALVTTESSTHGGGSCWTPAFWLDSGASHHAVGDAGVLCNLRDPPAGAAVRVADGFRLLVAKVGDIQTQDIQIPDVFLVPGLRMNLISVRQLAKSKIILTFYENDVELWREGEWVGGAIADDETSLYRLHHLTATGNNAAAPSS